MPIIVQEGLPAYELLKHEDVFVMNPEKAEKQDIRALRIALVNLMPLKEVTEAQLIRMLANSPLQVELSLIGLESHEATHADPLHMETFYRSFEEIKYEYFDGLIITGAPVELLPFDEVDYWNELKEIMEYSKTHVYSTLHLCWGAQAGLYYHYGIDKRERGDKLFGVFEHRVLDPHSEFTRGFDEAFYAPHSRYTESIPEAVLAEPRLQVLAESDEAGQHMLVSADKRYLFLQGHFEYDRDTLYKEYQRDTAKGVGTQLPRNYFRDDDPEKDIIMRWSGHGNLFFANWLNYVYQMTPYNLRELSDSYDEAGM